MATNTMNIVVTTQRSRTEPTAIFFEALPMISCEAEWFQICAIGVPECCWAAPATWGRIVAVCIDPALVLAAAATVAAVAATAAVRRGGGGLWSGELSRRTTDRGRTLVLAGTACITSPAADTCKLVSKDRAAAGET